MSADIKLVGIDKIQGKLDNYTDISRAHAALTKACLLVERSAKQKAPKGDGTLRNSITHKVTDTNGLEGVVYTPLFYAPYVEYGTGLFAEEGGRTDVPWCYKDIKTDEFVYTSGMHPHPYMRPALDENREQILRILWEGIHQ